MIKIEIDDSKEAVYAISEINELMSRMQAAEEKLPVLEKKCQNQKVLINQAAIAMQHIFNAFPGLKSGNFSDGLDMIQIMKLGGNKKLIDDIQKLATLMADYEKTNAIPIVK